MLQEPDRYGTRSLFELVAEYAATEGVRRGIPGEETAALFESVVPLAA
jgi:hypothetical protein